MAVQVYQPVGSAAQELFAWISASSYLDVVQTIAGGRHSPSLAITAIVAPEINISISTAAQKSMVAMSAAVDNDVV